jgi:hypothetical protein
LSRAFNKKARPINRLIIQTDFNDSFPIFSQRGFSFPSNIPEEQAQEFETTGFSTQQETTGPAYGMLQVLQLTDAALTICLPGILKTMLILRNALLNEKEPIFSVFSFR